MLSFSSQTNFTPTKHAVHSTSKFYARQSSQQNVTSLQLSDKIM